MAVAVGLTLILAAFIAGQSVIERAGEEGMSTFKFLGRKWKTSHALSVTRVVIPILLVCVVLCWAILLFTILFGD